MCGPSPSGLCETCTWMRLVSSARSVFVLCRRGLDDPAFPKYPRLPVTRCAGYDPAGAGGSPAPPPDGAG